MKKSLVLFCILCNSAVLAENIPSELAYPPYSRQKDKISFSNLKNEFRSRQWSHIMRERENMRCWKSQRRIAFALNGMRNEKKSIPDINDDFIFNEESVFKKYKKLPIEKVVPNCSFASYGNLNDDSGIIYCKYHGTEKDWQSDFAKKHKSDFMKFRPFINVVDVLEALYILPGILLLSLSVFLMNRILK